MTYINYLQYRTMEKSKNAVIPNAEENRQNPLEATINLLPEGVARLKTSRLTSSTCGRVSMSSSSEALTAAITTQATANCNTVEMYQHLI
jgi:hypothetical protein